MAATKEDIESLQKSMDTLSELVKGLSTRVEKVENINEQVLPKTIKRIQEKLSQLSNDYKYLDMSTKGISLDKKLLPNKFSTIDILSIDIEDELLKARVSNNGNNGNSRKTDNPSSSSSHQNINFINNVDADEILALDKDTSKTKKPRREFTPIGISYNVAFDRLYDWGLIKPIGPTEDPAPEKRSSRWNPNSYCKYHRGNGHTTDECYRLQNLIQDLIDANNFHSLQLARRLGNNETRHKAPHFLGFS
ncbi:uncharacterized protein LOC110694306 [Chenopodium quinoa]|uniref:uncharacterized protein LOC110694306 n=1 Tax=Chenopodium quinoa TaxID=63459 RepID=UPI000B78044E|nr:uncharacterized protein LOC110694306 [Chenopodium quinoa]